MDYHDFSDDNNPFVGSNHFYSNGFVDMDMESDAMAHDGLHPESSDNDDIVESDNEDNNRRCGRDNHKNDDNGGDKDTRDNKQEGNEENNDFDDDEADYSVMDTTYDSIPYSVYEQPTFYVPTMTKCDTNAQFQISTFEILKDYKGTRTIYYKIENSAANTHILRRYNDFRSLRSYLSKFYPYLFIPPIPEKHSLSRFLKNPFNYKSDMSIIELRIRLLNYFLMKINNHPTLSTSPIVVKFLDPLINNWNSCLNSPPFTNLSSNSFLLVSTRNPTKPSPYFSYLPIPPLTLLKTFSTRLNSQVFQKLENQLKIFLKIIVNLETKMKNLIKTLNALRVNLVEFGAVLNIFSIMENQNYNIEKFGNKIDLNFLNIEILSTNLSIKIKEPLIIMKNSVIYLLQMLHFRKLKELQFVYFQNIIQKKQSRLKSLVNSINTQPILPALDPNSSEPISSPSLNLAIENMKLKNKSHQITVENLSNESKQQILSEIKTLNNELNSNLVPCFKFLLDDVQFLSVQVEKNTKHELKHLLQMMSTLQQNWKSNVWGEYFASCLDVWKK